MKTFDKDWWSKILTEQVIDEIKINKPNSLNIYLEPEYANQPYYILKDNTKFYGYLGNNDFIEWQNVGDEFIELINNLKQQHIKHNFHSEGEFVTVDKKYLNINNLNEIKSTNLYDEFIQFVEEKLNLKDVKDNNK